MPVALVITDLDVGGAEKALVGLATGLERSRWSPAVYCLGPEGALARTLCDVGIQTTCLAVSKRRPATAILRLAAALRVQRPWLIQSFLFHANLAARLAAPLAGRPWVVGGLRVAEREQGWHRWLDRWTCWLSAGSVCVSEGVRRFSLQVGRLREERLVVIPNGIDPVSFDGVAACPRRELGVPDSAHLVLFVGRLEAQKGLEYLLEAAAVVAAERPEWHLALVGDGPVRRRFQGQLRCPDRVHWLGRRGDVPALLKAADLLVLPSLWEGMPNVVLEAMAARRAVVATAVEGTEDLVVSGQTGWLVPPGDPRALAAALVDAASDPDRLRRFGAAGRQRVERQFAQAAVIAAYDRLWSRVLGFAEAS